MENWFRLKNTIGNIDLYFDLRICKDSENQIQDLAKKYAMFEHEKNCETHKYFFLFSHNFKYFGQFIEVRLRVKSTLSTGLWEEEQKQKKTEKCQPLR